MNINDLLVKVTCGLCTLDAALKALPLGEERTFLSRLDYQVKSVLLKGPTMTSETERLKALYTEIEVARAKAEHKKSQKQLQSK